MFRGHKKGGRGLTWKNRHYWFVHKISKFYNFVKLIRKNYTFRCKHCCWQYCLMIPDAIPTQALVPWIREYNPSSWESISYYYTDDFDALTMIFLIRLSQQSWTNFTLMWSWNSKEIFKTKPNHFQHTMPTRWPAGQKKNNKKATIPPREETLFRHHKTSLHQSETTKSLLDDIAQNSTKREQWADSLFKFSFYHHFKACLQRAVLEGRERTDGYNYLTYLVQSIPGLSSRFCILSSLASCELRQ